LSEEKMTDLLQVASSLGVGAFLGLIIFLMYRQDRKDSFRVYREDRSASEERLTNLLHEAKQTRQDNTRALQELTTLISRMNGKH